MSIRIATRAVIVKDQRLLLVNAFPDQQSDLWCAPGGGAEAGASLPDNLQREVFEETGLRIRVGPPCLVNEFHEPKSGFHQVEIFFRCTITDGALSDDWQDPEAVVNRRRFVSAEEMADLRVKPDSLAHVAFARGMGYDPLETLVR
ncbi:pyrimidine (deoxy)nucleoside triphosphate pyrophosphohydrolase [Roseovarius gaetbuli]|uniref:Pyrimidine (Deoxy)nucleoside triphosphate pyrophosphohydrolase n=1 Tax=Roseovarius gaetbuli TaxID=1356575 RepID=A0A1X6ZEF4_9RHOB|nr:NUDIX domain-containing protein [Roseovarius gaetbuli]SLN49424.1 pyrimidine (deoxy)nucleoside triphosphate pyrophosphohydrolase [Roseovarius gaetbuli]